MADVDVTEIVELEARKVSGVGSPANGIDFVLIKAAADGMEACSTCKGNGKILEGNRECPDCKGKGEVAQKSDSAEADEQQEEMTGETSKQADEWEALDKALNDSERAKMPAGSFAFIDKNGKRHLPVHDAGHTKAALGRFNQQDFSEAKGDPADAKKKAAAKILSAAKQHGIEVDSKSNVAEAAKKGAVQDSLGGNNTPEMHGRFDSGTSGAVGSVAMGTADQPTDSSLALGGRSTAAIPIERKVTTNPPPPVSTDGAGIVNPMAKALAVSSLWEALDQIESTRAAIKAGTFTQAVGDAALSPGSVPWESFDAANLKQIAETLAGCCSALDYMSQREREESLTADPDDIENAWDLEEAASALDYAMGVVARLSFHEAVEGDATKSADDGFAKVGRKLSGKTATALTAARDHLNSVLDSGVDNDKAGSSGDDDKETIDMASVTKDELGEIVVKAVKAVKKQEKLEKKEAKKLAAEEETTKNANNGGDVTTADIKPTSEHDAEDIQSVGGSVDPQFVNKGTDDAELETSQLADLQKSVAALTETVGKIAKRARPVGPSLDGNPPVLDPAVGGRLGGVPADADVTRITELKKALDTEQDPHRRAIIGEELTKANLTAMFRARGLDQPAIPAPN
jgi:hypothetical protein